VPLLITLLISKALVSTCFWCSHPVPLLMAQAPWAVVSKLCSPLPWANLAAWYGHLAQRLTRGTLAPHTPNPSPGPSFLQADPNPRVRTTMVEAGAALINQHGKENVALLLPILESYLNKKVRGASCTQEQ